MSSPEDPTSTAVNENSGVNWQLIAFLMVIIFVCVILGVLYIILWKRRNQQKNSEKLAGSFADAGTKYGGSTVKVETDGKSKRIADFKSPRANQSQTSKKELNSQKRSKMEKVNQDIQAPSFHEDKSSIKETKSQPKSSKTEHDLSRLQHAYDRIPSTPGSGSENVMKTTAYDMQRKQLKKDKRDIEEILKLQYGRSKNQDDSEDKKP